MFSHINAYRDTIIIKFQAPRHLVSLAQLRAEHITKLSCYYETEVSTGMCR